jgi:cystathionine beta-lyase/cystathionine gamma-synthase
MDISYIINELGEERENYFNAIAPPIVQTSNFACKTVADLRAAFEDEYSVFLYSRGNNPTVDILRKKLAALEGAEDCLVVNSGAAAIYAAVMANVQTGDHVISVQKPYASAQKLFDVIFPKFDIEITYVDGRDIINFENAIQSNTKLIYVESPNSWNFHLQDLEAVAKLAKQKNIVTIIDNSYCTPLYQQPILLGIDISIQSATKYISGHSDVIAGVIAGSKAMIHKIFTTEYMTIGSGIQPFNAWLLLRGLRTLPMRLAHISNTTKEVVYFLKQHKKVEKVIFPFDENFEQYQLAKKQMQGACGLVTFILKADNVQQIETFCNTLQHILMAVSWGGYESLIIPKCSSFPIADFDANNPEHRMVRLYVGQEDAGYIIKDLGRGFATV